MSTLPAIYFPAKAELDEIMQAGAKSLKPLAAELQPVKVDMLTGLAAETAALVVQACDMLYAACLEYEDALIAQRKAQDAVSLVTARIRAGIAEGVCESLFHGPTAQLLYIAMDTAPVAYYGLSKGCPDFRIIDRTAPKSPK